MSEESWLAMKVPTSRARHECDLESTSIFSVACRGLYRAVTLKDSLSIDKTIFISWYTLLLSRDGVGVPLTELQDFGSVYMCPFTSFLPGLHVSMLAGVTCLGQGHNQQALITHGC